MSEYLVISHSGCRDGFAAAWVASKKLPPDTEFVFTGYGEEVPEVKGKDVYILDFSYPRTTLERMKAEAASLLVLDHHKSAEEDLRGLDYARFDLTVSGARMALQYFFPQVEYDPSFSGPRRPYDPFVDKNWIVDYVEDRDLWRWRLDCSRAVSAYLNILPFEFEAWDKAFAGGAAHAAMLGTPILREIESYVQSVVTESAIYTVFGLSVPVVNCAYKHSSEILEILAKASPSGVAMSWHQRKDGKIKYSLRAAAWSQQDVAHLAQRYGGGGHAKSAGFETDGIPIHFQFQHDREPR